MGIKFTKHIIIRNYINSTSSPLTESRTEGEKCWMNENDSKKYFENVCYCIQSLKKGRFLLDSLKLLADQNRFLFPDKIFVHIYTKIVNIFKILLN